MQRDSNALPDEASVGVSRTRSLLTDEESAKAELKFLLGEYQTLRAEILDRLGVQIQLTYIAMGLLAGLLAFAPFVLLSGAPSSPKIPPVYIITGLLILSLIFTSLQWAFLNEDINIALIGVYYQTKLRARVASLVGADEQSMPILSWERFLHGYKFPRTIRIIPNMWIHTILSGSRFVVIMVPALISLIGGFILYVHYFSNFDVATFNGITWINIALFVWDLFYLLAVLPALIYSASLFREIPRTHNPARQ